MRVSSVSKQDESLWQAASAVSVVTSEDIRRTGVLRLAEAIRLAAGAEVAQVDAQTWAVTMRGFNEVYANKLLVLIDGRSVYNPFFSGVLWESQEVFMPDVERIEVIRGPGATLWGANAVNGVINIRSKSAHDTQGGLAQVGAGTDKRDLAAVRWGGQLGAGWAYRVYAQQSTSANAERLAAPGDDLDTGGERRQFGFRLDSAPGGRTRYTVQADWLDLNVHSQTRMPSLSPPYSTEVRAQNHGAMANLLGRVTHTPEAGGQIQVQAYYDVADLRIPTASEDRRTSDLDVQHRLARLGVHELMWGGNLRSSRSDYEAGSQVKYSLGSPDVSQASIFVQDQIQLPKVPATITVGTKFERTSFMNWQALPSARFSWMPKKEFTLWGAISRAVRAPSAIERGINTQLTVLPPGYGNPPLPLPLEIVGLGSPDFGAEKLIAIELGLRAQLAPRLVVEMAAFHNRYENLQKIAVGPVGFAPAFPPYLQQTSTFMSGRELESLGGEASVTWSPADSVRLRLDYSTIAYRYAGGSGPSGVSVYDPTLTSPKHRLQLRGDLELPHDFEFGWTARWSDSVIQGQVPAYFAADVRLGWHTKVWDISLIAQNLGHAGEAEFIQQYPVYINARTRSGYFAKVAFSF